MKDHPGIDLEKWRIFGHSYGVTIVMRYLTMFPEHLDAVFGHGNALVDPVEDYANRYAKQLQALEIFFARYPGDRKIWLTLMRSIP
jgi:pimeloyl-ACP methyl ester carboxylesterase